MNIPVHDWQFWVVTLICVVAAWFLFRDVLPVPFLRRARKRRKGEKRASLTISAKK